MNELERLLASVSRPEPSDELDRRVSALLAPIPTPAPRATAGYALLLCGTAVCVGLIGFYCGRLSVGAANGAAVTVKSPNPERPLESDPVSSPVLNVPLRRDQLAGLFVQSPAPEPMFGTGPLKVKVSTSP